MNDYFAIESSTGAVNGFYAIKKDCIDTTKYLSDRFVGSQWRVVETFKMIGADDQEYASQYHWKDKRDVLAHLFGDIEKDW